jgi:hypothetical protein
MREAIRRESPISWRRLVNTALESRHYRRGEDGGSTHHASYAEPDTARYTWRKTRNSVGCKWGIVLWLKFDQLVMLSACFRHAMRVKVADFGKQGCTDPTCGM